MRKVSIDIFQKLTRKVTKNVIWRQTVWSDLAKFCHFGIFLRVLDNFVLSNGAFGKILNILWQIFHAIGKINIFDNGQLLNK